jgi:putative transposase
MLTLLCQSRPMPQYRRLKTPDSTWFFTTCLAQPGSHLLTDRIDALREAYRRTAAEHPIGCVAMVVLPDRIHALWTLPDTDYSLRWRLIKGRFTHAVGAAAERRPSLLRRREGGIWQRRFWEHRIRDSADLAMHCDMCLTSPVAAGLVAAAEDWPFSTLHRDRRAQNIAA